MKRLVCLFCAFLFLILVTACGYDDAAEKSLVVDVAPVENNPAETTEDSTTDILAKYENPHKTFLIRNDVMIYAENNLAYVGTVDTDSDYVSDQDKYDAVTELQGVLPPLYEIELIFFDTPPISVSWSVTDGLVSSRTPKNHKISSPSYQTTISFEQSDWYVLSSSINHRPNRQVNIVCHYPDRIVEYFLVFKT